MCTIYKHMKENETFTEARVMLSFVEKRHCHYDKQISSTTKGCRKVTLNSKFAAWAAWLFLGAMSPASATAILELIDNEGHFAEISGTSPTL